MYDGRHILPGITDWTSTAMVVNPVHGQLSREKRISPGPVRA